MTKTARRPLPYQPIQFTRADPEQLAKFDPATRYCHMNCGPHRDDPREREERMFLCGDCYEVDPCSTS